MFFSPSLLAEIYIREYTYKASEADSKLSSRTIALDQVKLLLLQEIGTHLRQKINITKDGTGATFASEDVEAITAGLTKVDVLEEKWDGSTYYLKAKIQADAQRVINALTEYKNTRIENDLQQLEALKASQRALQESRDEIALLKQELKLAETDAQNQKLVAKYNSVLSKMSAADMNIKGYEFDEQGRYNEALYWYRKSAAQGDMFAKYNIGLMYHNGTGVKQDYIEAMHWFRKAAKQDYSGAQYNIGLMYDVGRGVDRDYVQALYWYQKAAEQGVSLGFNNIGVMYEEGKGVKQSFIKAFNWYKKSAEQGEAIAQYNLASLYANGRGVKLNFTEALHWCRKSAAHNHAPAQYFLGLLYENGDGVEADHNKAMYWYQKAAEQGDANARRILENIGA